MVNYYHYLRRKQIERAIDARRDSGQYHAHVSFKTFGAAVNQRNHGGIVQHLILVVRQKRNKHAVDPSARNHRVETADHQVKLPVKIFAFILDLTVVRRDPARGHTFVDEFGRDLRFGTVDVLLAEQKLSVQVGQVYGVHVDYVHVAEPHHGQVLEQFATQSASADDE